MPACPKRCDVAPPPEVQKDGSRDRVVAAIDDELDDYIRLVERASHVSPSGNTVPRATPRQIIERCRERVTRVVRRELG